MTIRPGIWLVLALVVMAMGGATPAAAQSLLVTRGLGLPVDPQDARARGLGGVGLGLPEIEISWANPAAMIGLQAPGMVAAYQYDSYTADGVSPEFVGHTARFPFVLAAFPAGQRVVLSAGYGGFLDQNWNFERLDTLIVATDSLLVLDQYSSTGGVARLRLAGAYQISQGLGVGAGIDLFTGSVERVQGRRFPGQGFPVCCFARWSYRGLGYTGGIHWSPSEATGIAASITFGGTLDASSQDTAAVSESYELPILVRLGASGRVAQNTLLALSGSWDGWSNLDDRLAADGGAQDSWSVQGGVEWDGINVRERQMPLRLGGRVATLPFRWGPEAVDEWPRERALTFGAGAVLSAGSVRPDLAFEFGSRGGDAAGIDESFWRFALSVKVLGR